MITKQVIFKREFTNQYFLVEISEDGKVYLKIKEDGWGDIWSLPLKEAKGA